MVKKMAPKRAERESLFAGRRMRRALGWVALAALAIFVIGLLTLQLSGRSAARAPQGVGTQSVATGPAIGGPFHLTNQAGAPADQRLLLGKWTAVFFGYTYCPDVCPTTLAALGQVSDNLGADQKRFQVVFITVDPERDTPAVLARYLSSATFPKGAMGLTGTPAQIAEVARAYHVFYQKVPQGSSYVMDHTAVVYLMDPKGQFTAPLDLTAPPAQAARHLRQVMD
jgi:protein SCO1/2